MAAFSAFTQEMTTMAKNTAQPTMNTLAAVREAVKTLGGDARIAQVRKWVKDQYGLNMTDMTAEKYFYQARKEVRQANGKPGAKTPKKPTTTLSSKFAPETTTMAKKTIEPTMSKMQAVREAVRELGLDSTPKEVSQCVKDRYNIDLTTATASNYVSTARKEVRDAIAKPATTKRAKSQPALSAARVTPHSPGNSASVEQIIDAVTALKGLVGKLGKGNVLKLVETL
jgi:hypothetical protein